MFNSLANTIVLRLQDSISKKNGKMLYAKSFGEVSVEILEAMENAHQYDFSLTVKVLPDLEQKAKFAQDLVDAVTSGSISFEDKLAMKGLMLMQENSFECVINQHRNTLQHLRLYPNEILQEDNIAL